MNDWQLLNEYAARNSEEAFRTLADRYTGMVYHAALRQLGNTHAAEEVTQAVFIALAAKAGRIPQRTVLSAWLFRATRYAVLNQLRSDASRQSREREAYHMQSTNDTNDANSIWEQVAPHLNDALDLLSQKDREAVMSRYFENKSHRDVAQALGVSEDAAKMRVSRALERLRGIFASRGIAVSLVALTTTFTAHAAQAAPIGLASVVASAAIAKGGAGSASTLASAKGILKLMALAKLKLTLVAGVALVAAAVTTAVVVERAQGGGNQAVAGDRLEGRVILPDGSAAANVTVYLCMDRQWLDLTPDGHLGPPMNEQPNGQVEPVQMQGYVQAARTQTDPDGRFVFNQSWSNSATVFVADDRGFAWLAASNLTKETPIALTPMTTVAGTLFVGAKPAANELVSILLHDTDGPYPSPMNIDNVGFNNKVSQRRNHVRTDANGHFSFRVPAGDYRLSHDLNLPVTWSGQGFSLRALTQTTPIHAVTGKTNTFQLGGQGRTVVGRVGGVGGDVVVWTNEAFFMEKKVPPPPESVLATHDWKQYQVWYHSTEGQAAIWATRRYFVQTGPDGSFKIQDVEPGEYELHFPLVKTYVYKMGNNSSGSSLNVADASIKFKIEPAAAAHDPDANPLDLGYLQRDWVTNWAKGWIKEGILVPSGMLGQEQRPGRFGPDPDQLAALEEQVKSRQSAKSTANETTIDLLSHVNAKLTEPLGEEIYLKDNTLAALPSGVHVFGGVPFNVSGLVQLAAASSYQLMRPLPEESGEIAVGKKFKKLHILDGALPVTDMRAEYAMNRDLNRDLGQRRRGGRPQPEQPPVAKLVLHYADGTDEELPIVPGQQFLDFEGVLAPGRLPDLPGDTELAWIGTNPYLKEKHPGWSLNLYRAAFQNPKPDVEVKSVVFVSTMTPTTAPFIAGLTIE